jgi:hypothetical protein
MEKVVAMNRREVLASLVTIGTAAKLPEGAKVTAVEAHEKPALAVITHPGHISRDTAERLREMFEDGLKGTPLDGVKVFVLGEGLQLKFYDKAGREAIEALPEQG